MQYKKSPNPIVEELTKSHTDRTVDLGSLRAVKLEDGSRLCVWCQDKKLGKHPNQKYCSPECSAQACAWAYPQKEEGLAFLMMRQDFCCNICKFDWKPILDQLVAENSHKTTIQLDYKNKFSWYLMKRLKSRMDWESKDLKKFKPEVDHIIPISKGGQSIGLDNHQVLCYTCHKNKSKIDNSGPRKKKVDK